MRVTVVSEQLVHNQGFKAFQVDQEKVLLDHYRDESRQSLSDTLNTCMATEVRKHEITEIRDDTLPLHYI